MTQTATPVFTPRQRRIALAWGIACHVSFAAGVLSMIAGLFFGMHLGLGTLTGGWAVVADLLLLAQFPIVHSLLLSSRGRKFMARLAPMGLGSALGTTTYAIIASLQLLATFVLWSPFGSAAWVPTGWAMVAASLVYAASWLLLLKTMADAGLGVQTGFLGWGSVVRGRMPSFAAFVPRGTFRWVRQPIYVAFALTLWTAPVWTADHVLIATAWTFYCVFAPLLKEKRYLAWHGETFAEYRRSVPYWIPRPRRAHLATLVCPVAHQTNNAAPPAVEAFEGRA